MKIKVVAIVPAAGLGKRFSASTRKPFAYAAGLPLLIYALKSLNDARAVTEIIPVIREEDMDQGLELIEPHNLNKVKQIVPGGKERQDSVNNALKVIKNDCLVLIHDGVRPNISHELIDRLLKEIKGVDGVIPGLPVKETLKEVDSSKSLAVSTVKREKFWAIQTPQVFQFAVLKQAYDKAYTDGFYATDDAALVERMGGKVKVITGDPFNIKVTTPEDLEMVEYFLNKSRNALRVTGYEGL